MFTCILNLAYYLDEYATYCWYYINDMTDYDYKVLIDIFANQYGENGKILKPEAASPWQPFQSVTARGRLEGSNVGVEMLQSAVQCKSLSVSALWQDEISGSFPMQMDIRC